VSDFQVFHPTTPEEFEAYFDLRWRILRAPWHQPRGSELDEFEDQAQHIAIRSHSGLLLGVARLHYPDNDVAQIRYMAVKENHQGQGIGNTLYHHLESHARSINIKNIIANARISVVGFYEQHGFVVIGDGPTLFDKIEHKLMHKVL
jgi:N-acetylglutamate synthase-like GNAT family acetyltransferase